MTVGDRVNPEAFTEVWYFVRQKDQWLLHAIAPLVMDEIIGHGRSYSEDLASGSEKEELIQLIKTEGNDGNLELPIW